MVAVQDDKIEELADRRPIDEVDDSDDDNLWNPALAMEKQRKRLELAHAAAQQEANAQQQQPPKRPRQPRQPKCPIGKEPIGKELDSLMRGKQSRNEALAKATEQLEADLTAAMDTGVRPNPML